MRCLRHFLAAALLLCGVASAAPAWLAELTPSTRGPHPALTPTALDFQISWKGMIRSGNLHLEFSPPSHPKPGAYVVRSSATSLGAAAALFPYSSDFWTEMDPASHRPRYFRAVEVDQKEHITTTVRYFSDRVVTREESKLLKTGTTSTQDSIFRHAPVFDIFSAMLHIRSQKLAPGDRIALVVCPFKSPYLLRVTVAAREPHAGSPAIRLNLSMRKIDPDTMELRPYKKLRGEASLWLSDNPDRIPLEFRANAFIGDVRAVLSRSRKL